MGIVKIKFRYFLFLVNFLVFSLQSRAYSNQYSVQFMQVLSYQDVGSFTKDYPDGHTGYDDYKKSYNNESASDAPTGIPENFKAEFSFKVPTFFDPNVFSDEDIKNELAAANAILARSNCPVQLDFGKPSQVANLEVDLNDNSGRRLNFVSSISGGHFDGDGHNHGGEEKYYAEEDNLDYKEYAAMNPNGYDGGESHEIGIALRNDDGSSAKLPANVSQEALMDYPGEVTLHELLHTLGFDHPPQDEEGNVMNAEMTNDNVVISADQCEAFKKNGTPINALPNSFN